MVGWAGLDGGCGQGGWWELLVIERAPGHIRGELVHCFGRKE